MTVVWIFLLDMLRVKLFSSIKVQVMHLTHKKH